MMRSSMTPPCSLSIRLYLACMGSSAATSAVIIRFSKRTASPPDTTTRPMWLTSNAVQPRRAARASGIMPSNAMGISNPANSTIWLRPAYRS